MSTRQVWFGRVDVIPDEGNDVLDGARGAVVNVVALASSEADYLALVRSTMSEYGFTVVHHEEVMPLADRPKSKQLVPELAALARGLTPEYPIQFDEFQSYDDFDA